MTNFQQICVVLQHISGVHVFIKVMLMCCFSCWAWSVGVGADHGTSTRQSAHRC